MAPGTDDAQIRVLLENLDKILAHTKHEYDRYFLGLLKIEPGRDRRALDRSFRELSLLYIKNTASKFKYQQLKARYASLSVKWAKNLRMIENGTYPRDQFRLKLKLEEEAQLKREQATGQAGREVVRKRTAKEKLDTVTDAERLQQVYRDFMDSRKRCNERTDNVEFRKMVQFMTQQTTSVKAKFGCSAVQFKVVEDEGRTKLKVIPIK